MRASVIAYLATAAVVAGLDVVWLRLTMEPLYHRGIGGLMAQDVNLPAAIAFYVVYVAGIVVFAVSPALGERAWTSALIHGALFGFFAYATYDLTNLATLRGWPLSLSLIDMAWGTVLTAVAAGAGTATALALGR
jgi:uncharacterized membrane protein